MNTEARNSISLIAALSSLFKLDILNAHEEACSRIHEHCHGMAV